MFLYTCSLLLVRYRAPSSRAICNVCFSIIVVGLLSFHFYCLFGLAWLVRCTRFDLFGVMVQCSLMIFLLPLSPTLSLSTYLFSAPLLYVYAENVSTINFTRIVVCAAIICNELYELYIVPISFTRIFLQITMKTIEQKIRFTKNDGRFSFTKMHPTHSTEL